MTMHREVMLSLLLWLSATLPLVAQTSPEPVDLADPLIGTDSEYALSNGNTYPAIALPWGMNFWTPQTGPMGDGWGYTYDAFKIRGFKQTHQPSPWINDYAAFSLLPQSDSVIFDEDLRASWFSHKRETANPAYYEVYLADYDTWVEITPTARAAHFRFTFGDPAKAYVLLDAFHEGSKVAARRGARRIEGYCRNNSGGVPDNFHNFFVAEFSEPFAEVLLWRDSTVVAGASLAEGDHAMAAVGFGPDAPRVITVKVASSFISPEQARLNLEREIGAESFDETHAKARAAWNRELGRFRVTGSTSGHQVNFYTALYRTMLFPRPLHEIDAAGDTLHYSPYNGKVLPGYLYTDNGFWDTFRAVFPFFTIAYRQLDARIMRGLVNTYLESGWLPEWASPGHRNAMIGSNSAVNIADAWLRGIRGYDIETLYEAIRKNSRREGPLASVGRLGVDHYNRLGYIPYDVGVRENVARTLEYAFADHTIAELAESLGRPAAEIDTFSRRAQYYRNVFDPSTNFMRGKMEDGSWQRPFRPDKWGDAFTEGSAWHYTWSVFHDPQGLINLMGGEDAFIDKLDSVFTAPPTFDYSYYGIQIHEITEMIIAGMGQYAHGNQPIQHGVYLYNYTSQPWKAQRRVREIMDLLYTPTPDGLCGDEDNGQTSAWFVFSAMGFYPVCPGSGQYVLGSPLFDRMDMDLENGRRFIVEARNNRPENIYIQEARWQGEIYTKNYITHDMIMGGGKLTFMMGPEPNPRRGTLPDDRPFSVSTPDRGPGR